MGQVRSQGLAVILLIAGGLGGGVVAAATSPACQRFVRKEVLVPVRNRVSKATVEAWKRWGVGHPDWKPNPNVHRPKYVMTRKEMMDKVAFACEVTPTPKTLDDIFPPVAGVDLPPVVDLPPTGTPMELTEVTFPGDIPPVGYEDLPPTEMVPPVSSDVPYFPPILPPVFGGAPGGGGGSNVLTPVVPPVTPPPAIAPVAEPSSWSLVGLGLVGGWFLWLKRLKA